MTQLTRDEKSVRSSRPNGKRSKKPINRTRQAGVNLHDIMQAYHRVSLTEDGRVMLADMDHIAMSMRVMADENFNSPLRPDRGAMHMQAGVIWFLKLIHSFIKQGGQPREPDYLESRPLRGVDDEDDQFNQ